MRRLGYQRKRLFFYAVPILIGMAGLFFSAQLDSFLLRFMVVLLSVSVPLFAGGHFVARHATHGMEKVLLLSGGLFLVLGAAASLAIYSEHLADQQFLPKDVAEISRWLGMLSLLLGLFVVLFSVVRTGEAIEEIREHFEHLAVHISEGFVLSGTDGTIILVNQRFLDMMGLSEEEVLGKNANDLVVQHDMEVMEPHLDLRAKGVASEYEMVRYVDGDERNLWVSGTPVFDRFGRHTGTLATMRDVTEKTRMARRLERYARGLQDLVEEQTQKLRRSEEQFRGLLLHMNEGFLTIDSSYRVRFVNNRVCEHLGLDSDQILGREVFEFVDPPGRLALMELLQSKRSEVEGASKPEFNLISADGSVLPALVAVAPVRDEGAGDQRHSLVITDVSELKTMQRQLELRAHELEAANEELRLHDRAKDGFLSNVSHELKTPLSTVSGYVEMLSSGNLGELSGPQSSALKVMGRNLQRLVALINEMIEFSRMEIRGIRPNISLFSVARLVREAVAAAQPHALGKDISIGAFVPENERPVWGDRGKLAQVLGVLLDNAVKFSTEGGMVQINVSDRPGNALAIAVQDTGIGIEPGYHARVFDKFFQVDASKSRRYEGTGIGLSIAKTIVAAHGGHLELESELHKGCTFTIVLSGSLFDLEAPAEDIKSIEGLRVLVTAAGRTFRDSMTDLLEACGCLVSEARNAFECVRLAEETEPDLVLLDEADSESGGFSAISHLRRSPVTSAIPILVLSCEEGYIPGDFHAMDPEVYPLTKPFSAKSLIQRVYKASLGEGRGGELRPAGLDEAEPRALVVDRDDGLRDWLAVGLAHRNVPCSVAAEVSEALDIAGRTPPDIVFLDVDAARPSIEATVARLRQAEATRNATIFIMGAGPALDRALSPGVAGTIRKPFDIDTIAGVIHEKWQEYAREQAARNEVGTAGASLENG